MTDTKGNAVSRIPFLMAMHHRAKGRFSELLKIAGSS